MDIRKEIELAGLLRERRSLFRTVAELEAQIRLLAGSDELLQAAPPAVALPSLRPRPTRRSSPRPPTAQAAAAPHPALRSLRPLLPSETGYVVEAGAAGDRYLFDSLKACRAFLGSAPLAEGGLPVRRVGVSGFDPEGLPECTFLWDDMVKPESQG